MDPGDDFDGPLDQGPVGIEVYHCAFSQFLDHAEMGRTCYIGFPVKLCKTPGEVRMPSPLLGEHTEYVCTKILGMSDEEFIRLLQAGIFE